MTLYWKDVNGRNWPVCACLKEWLTAYQDELLRVGEIKYGLDLFQTIGNAPASAGYHAKGGNVDTGQRSPRAIRIARNMGGAAWSRGAAERMTPHGHITLKSCPHNPPGPRWQVTELEAGRNGLVNRGRDTGPRDGVRWPLRSYKDGIKWAKAQAKAAKPAPPKPTPKPVARHFEHRHLNTWGDDGGKGTASFYDRIDDMVKDLVSGINPEVITLNEVKADQVPSWVKRLNAEGYDVVLAEAGNLVAIPHGSEVRKAQTKYLPASIQGEGRREALGMVRAKINGHWEHIFVSHLDYRDGAKFDALRVKQGKWITSEAKRWSAVFALKSWLTHTTIGIDENSNTWVRDKAFKPSSFKTAVKSGIDAIYGNRPTLDTGTIATKSDHPIVRAVYSKTVK